MLYQVDPTQIHETSQAASHYLTAAWHTHPVHWAELCSNAFALRGEDIHSFLLQAQRLFSYYTEQDEQRRTLSRVNEAIRHWLNDDVVTMSHLKVYDRVLHAYANKGESDTL